MNEIQGVAQIALSVRDIAGRDGVLSRCIGPEASCSMRRA